MTAWQDCQLRSRGIPKGHGVLVASPLHILLGLLFWTISSKPMSTPMTSINSLCVHSPLSAHWWNPNQTGNKSTLYNIELHSCCYEQIKVNTKTPRLMSLRIIDPGPPQQYLKCWVCLSKFKFQPLELCHQVLLHHLELQIDSFQSP